MSDNGNSLDDEHADALDSFIDFTRRTRSNSTAEIRKSGVKHFLQWCEDNGLRAGEVTDEKMMSYLDTMLGYADTTFSSRAESLSRFFIYLNGRDYEVNQNPMADIDIYDQYNISPDKPKKLEVLDSDDEVVAVKKHVVEQLFDHPGAPALRNELILKLLWQTGLRQSELASVKFDDLDRDDREIEVQTAKAEPGNENYKRSVWYHENLDYLMNEWVEHRRNAFSTAYDSEYLFVSRKKSKLRPVQVNRIVRKAAEAAGVQEPMYEDAAGKTRWLITSHTIRHSYATHAANERDMPIHLLKDLMGHKTIHTTEKYISKDKKTLKRAAHEYGPR